MGACRTLTAVLLVLFPGFVRPVAAQEMVVLRIYDSAGLPNPQAVAVSVERVLARAGIRMTWMSCRAGEAHDDQCPGELTVRDLVVRVRPGAARDGSATCAAALMPDAPAVGHFLTIFAECATRAADHFGVRLETVLAYCLLHEIGHLVLPTAEHEPFGIMAPSLGGAEWRLAVAGRLRFSERQAAQMRAHLQ
jgi:hypothetical protein